MEFACGQNFLRFLKWQRIINQILVKFWQPKIVSEKSTLVCFILLENKPEQLGSKLIIATQNSKKNC